MSEVPGPSVGVNQPQLVNVNALHALCGKELGIAPVYKETSREGRSHERVFTVTCTIGTNETTGTGYNLKGAKDDAARKMIETLGDLLTTNPPTPYVQASAAVTPPPLTQEVNSVGKLQEYCQKRPNAFSTPTYDLETEEGPPFAIVCKLQSKNDNAIIEGRGRGNSKVSAKQQAASVLLANLLSCVLQLETPPLTPRKPDIDTEQENKSNSLTYTVTPKAPNTTYNVKEAGPSHRSSSEPPQASNSKITVPSSDEEEDIDETGLVLVANHISYYPTQRRGQSINVFNGVFCDAAGRKKKIAVKRLPSHELPEVNDLSILILLDHQNIVRYILSEECAHTRDKYLAMEPATHSLEEYLNIDGNKNRFMHLKQILVHATVGLEYLHSRKPKPILHRDIKPANILIFINRNQEIVAKLGDFGISKEVVSIEYGNTTSPKGTLNWMPPEALDALDMKKQFQIHPNFDLFSLGLTMFYTMAGGTHAFRKTCDLDIPLNIKNVNAKPNWNFVTLANHEFLKFELLNLLQTLLTKDPKLRPKLVSLVMEHPFFWNFEKKLEFILEVSNDLKTHCKKGTKDGVVENPNESLDPNPRDILEKSYQEFWMLWKRQPYDEFNWQSQLCQTLIKFVQTRKNKKSYRYKKIISLIEFIRDHYQHIDEWKDNADMKDDSVFGRRGENYARYFVTRFPDLVPFLYCYFQKPSERGLKTAKFYEINNGAFETFSPLVELPIFEQLA